ncbi:MAG: FAD-dependent monooxygenase [Variovorax sp.]
MAAAHILIAGAGIAGLASALALARRGHGVDVCEQAPAFAEVGAGIQLGPNVTRRLQSLGLLDDLLRVAAQPEALVVRSAVHGGSIARLPLGGDIARRYGAPYLCARRADVHALLLNAVHAGGKVALAAGVRIADAVGREGRVCVSSADGRAWDADALIGADGLWSAMRSQVIENSPPPRSTGHTAWRALVVQSALPQALRSREIDVWLGPRLHAVAYPVQRGDALNVVVLAESAAAGDARDWNRASSLAALQAATGRCAPALQALIEAMPSWGAWTLHDRPPLTGPEQMAADRVGLVGDAAHPMLPYLAQGAGMAIEDAVALADALGGAASPEVPAALTRYAAVRWERNARVQARARRNGEIFHATGPIRVGRDAALRVLGSRLLDLPWLYGG